MKEAEFQDRIQHALRERNVYVRSLVGNMLQSGLPDMLVIPPSGFVFHVENKVWRKRFPPNAKDDFVGLLDGPQRRVITEEFWGRSAYCPIIAFEDVNIRSAFMYDNLSNTIVRNDWMEYVRYFASLPKS